MKKWLKIFFVGLGGGVFASLFFIGQVFVYDTNIAHPSLTKSVTGVYNAQAGARQLSDQEIGWLMQGAIDEDYPFRWMNHFYDPIHNVGLKGSYDSAKIWAKNAQNQASFSLGDQSWQRAIYEYQQGNKKQAFLAVGHILHLLEDMTVPAHTRDDAHPNGDPYEQWVKNNFKAVSAGQIYFDSLEKYFDYLANYSNKNFYSEDTINSPRYNEPELSRLKENENYLYDKFGGYRLLFVKEDVRSGIKKYYANDESVLSDYFSLLAPKAVGAGAGVIKLFFEEVAKGKVAAPTSVQTNLWGGLQQPTGRVVTFLEETMNSAKKIVSQPGSFTSYVSFASDLFGSGVALAKDLNDMPAVRAVTSLSSETKLVNQVVQAVLPMAASSPVASSPMAAKAPSLGGRDSSVELGMTAGEATGFPIMSGMTESKTTSEDSSAKFIPTEASGLGTTKITAPVSPSVESKPAPVATVSGGSSYSGPSFAPVSVGQDITNEPVVSTNDTNTSTVKSEPPPEPPPPPPPPPDITPPEAPVILDPASSTLWTKSATTMIIGLVSLDTFKLIMNNSEEQTSSSVWSKGVALSEGENIFGFSAQDLAGNQSATATVKIYKDTTAPTSLVNVQTVSSSHLNLNVSWSASDGAGSGVAFYDVEYKKQSLGLSSSTDWIGWQTAVTITQAAFTGEEGNEYFFRARAADKLGNVGEWAESAAQTINWPRVVINEIAWAGTKAQANDEWLELYNASSTPVDLTGWTLIDNDKDDIRITFATGSIIAARGFYLLERTADTTVANIKADIIYAGSLKNSGEKLQLWHRQGQLIDEVDFARGWPAGSTGQDPISMERISPTASGSNANNWQSTPGMARNGYDAKGNSIYGTPKHHNSSLSYLNGTMSASRNLSADYNPYFLGTFTVASGTVLTAQPGAVIIGGSGSRVSVYGEMKTEGTAENPVVFTSLNDINYKGDAVASAPYWEFIKFFSGAKGDFKNTRLLYGNNASQGSTASGGVLQSDGAVFNIEKLEIGFSNTSTADYRLISLINSTSTIGDSKFSGGLGGLYFSGGAATIQNSQIENLGLWALEADSLNSLILENNTFKNNGWVYPTRPFWQQPSSLTPILVKNFVPEIKNNIFDNNTINAPVVSGQIKSAYILSNVGDWPWVSGGLTITASGTLEIKAGSKLKMLAGSTIIVNGVLNVLGTADTPVSVTSYHDDSDGTDVDLLNNQPAGKEGNEWRQIIFESVATSTLNYLNISFANGTPRDANSAGSVFVNNTPLLLNNLTIRYSRPSSAALQLKNTNTTVIGGLIKNETKIPFDPSSASYGVGILIDGGAPSLSSLIIDTFTYGIIKKNKPSGGLGEINFINVDKQIMSW